MFADGALAADAPIPSASPVAAPTGVSVSGRVVDSSTGLALSAARLTANGPVTKLATSRNDGSFSFAGMIPGIYTVTVEADRYQTTVSDSFSVTEQSVPNLTLSIQRSANASSGSLRVIGSTSVRAASSLQRSTIDYKSVTPENVINQGQYRLADALVRLPGISDGSSQTAAPADDITLVFRGLGTLETSTLIDGHPIAYGLSGGYNFTISPPWLFRNTLAVYGLGNGALYPVNAIGGVVDMLTLEPTQTQQLNLTQTYGTWTQLGTGLSASGPLGKHFGYAAAASVFGTDGPFKGLNNYNYSAAQDPASTGFWQTNTGRYPVGTNTVTKSLLGKLQYNLDNGGRLTLTGLTSSFYDNKTGNGDNDYYTPQQAFQDATNQLNSNNTQNSLNGTNTGVSYPVYSIGANPAPVMDSSGTAVTANCPAGLVPITSSFGPPAGSYSTPEHPNQPRGVPGSLSSNAPPGTVANAACVTPQVYSNTVSGWQGAGPAFQTYNIGDYSLNLVSPVADGTFKFQGYTDQYRHHYDRSLAVPSTSASSYDEILANTGFTLSVTRESSTNTLGLGFWYNNDFYSSFNSAVYTSSSNASDFSAYISDVYKFQKIPLTVYANVWEKYGGVTQQSFTDPRLALVYNLPNDVIRVAAGGTSTEPGIETVNSPFAVNSVAALAGTNYTCDPLAPLAIGSAGGGVNLKPERAMNYEAGYGHRFGPGSSIEIDAYTSNIFNYLYNFTAPLTITGIPNATLLPPATLQAYINYLQKPSNCGPNVNPLAYLGISGPVNLGYLRARGFDITGQQRFARHAIFDYLWALSSTVPLSASEALYANNTTLIQGSQIPGTPLHKWNVGMGYEFPHAIYAHIAYDHLSENNAKNLPQFGLWDMQVNAKVGPGLFAIGVNNLFNQRADYRGLISLGYPQATNKYAVNPNGIDPATGNVGTASSGYPSPTERFSLPYRTITFTYNLSVR